MPLYDVRCVALIYCLKRQDCGRYVLLNRESKPIGFYTRDYTNYADFPVGLTVRITPKTAMKISYRGDPDTKEIFLYSDGCHPLLSDKDWANYSNRLKVLASLRLNECVQKENSVCGMAIRAMNLKPAKVFL